MNTVNEIWIESHRQDCEYNCTDEEILDYSKVAIAKLKDLLLSKAEDYPKLVDDGAYVVVKAIPIEEIEKLFNN